MPKHQERKPEKIITPPKPSQTINFPFAGMTGASVRPPASWLQIVNQGQNTSCPKTFETVEDFFQALQDKERKPEKIITPPKPSQTINFPFGGMTGATARPTASWRQISNQGQNTSCPKTFETVEDFFQALQDKGQNTSYLNPIRSFFETLHDEERKPEKIITAPKPSQTINFPFGGMTRTTALPTATCRQTSNQLPVTGRTEVCPFCKKQFDPRGIRNHIASCSKKYFKCDLCCEHVLREARDVHLSFQCKMLPDLNLSDVYECPLCGEQMLQTEKSAHESSPCPNFNFDLLQIDEPLRTQVDRYDPISVYTSQVNYALPNIGGAAARRPQSISAELPVTGRTEVCPFCKKQFPPPGIHRHIASCSKKYFECDLCYEHVLREDRDAHLDFQCKMLQDEISSDFYQCPLCGEQMLQTEKSAHESSACPVLLQIDEPLSSSRNERTSRNYATAVRGRNICAYCDKELRADTSKELHLRDCEVYQQINPDSRQVPERDRSGSTSVELPRCVICLDKERNIFFQPCGHLVVCENCAEGVQSTCPVCRKHIQKKVKAYIN